MFLWKSIFSRKFNIAKLHISCFICVISSLQLIAHKSNSVKCECCSVNYVFLQSTLSPNDISLCSPFIRTKKDKLMSFSLGSFVSERRKSVEICTVEQQGNVIFHCTIDIPVLHNATLCYTNYRYNAGLLAMSSFFQI